MAFDPALALPIVRLDDLKRLNKLVRPDPTSEHAEPRRPIQELKRHHGRWMDRVLMGYLSPSQYVVLSAIVARTFGFGKIVEAIPLSVFSGGMRDPSDPTKHHKDDEGMPYFLGTGLTLNPIRRALDELAARRMIERYRMVGSGRDTHAYMPVSFIAFRTAASADLEVEQIPDCFNAGWDQPFSEFEGSFLEPWSEDRDRIQQSRERHLGQIPVSFSDIASITM